MGRSSLGRELRVCPTRWSVSSSVESVSTLTRLFQSWTTETLRRRSLDLGMRSRAKVKFNVNRVDNMIIQSIAMLDVLDKDLNQFAMRAKEWYSWHFPELVRIVSDNVLFNRCVLLIGDKSTLTEDSLEALENIVGDDVVANTILV